jgi:hypothetical protein
MTIKSDQLIGKQLALCDIKECVCCKHPKYKGKRKPSTTLTLADGCTCHIAWQYICDIKEHFKVEET